MFAWLKHMWKTAPPAQDADALLQVIRLSARVLRERNPDAAAKLEQSGDALDQAIKLTRRHGDQPTNDELTAILSHARLDIQDQFSAQMDLSKAILTAVRGTEAAVGELRATFHHELSALGEQVTNNEGRIKTVEAGLKESRQDRTDLRQQNEEAKQERARIEQKVDTLAQDFISFRDEIRRLIAGARKPEEVERLVDLIERHERELAAKRAEAGDAE